MLSSVIELDRDRPVALVERLLEVEQSLEVVQPLVGTQAPVSLPDQHTVPSTLCVPFPNFLDPRTCTVLARPRVLALFEKVLCHSPS